MARSLPPVPMAVSPLTMTIENRVRQLTGEFYSPTELQQFMNEAVRLVIGELPEEGLERIAAEETDSGTGITISDKRVLRAHKSGYKARLMDPAIRARLVQENNSYEAHEWRPAFYVHAGKVYVVPGGGTVLTVTPPTVTISQSTVTGIPSLLLDMFIARCARLVLESVMTQERGRITTTVDLPAAPAQAPPPFFSYSDAAAVAPSAKSIAALPSPEFFVLPSPVNLPAAPAVTDLDLTKKVDGSSLVPPVAPTFEGAIFTRVAAVDPAAVTVDPIPELGAFVAPPFSGDLSIPALPTIDLSLDVEGNALTPPVAPASSSFFSPQLLVAAPVPTTVEAAASAPVFTGPAYEGSLSLPAIPDLSFATDAAGNAIETPVDPGQPQLAYYPVAVPTPASVGVAALPSLPTAPSAVFAGDVASVVASLPGSFTPSATPPSSPSLGEIAFLPPSLGTIAQTSIEALPSVPSIVAPAFEGNLAAIVSDLPAALDLEGSGVLVPTAPALGRVIFTPQSGSVQSAATVTATLTTPTVAPIPLSLDLSDYEAYLGKEDPEMMGTILGEVGTQLQLRRTSLEQALGQFNGEIQALQLTLQKAVEQARLQHEAALGNAQRATEAALRSESERVATEAKADELELQQYGYEVQAYSARVSTLVRQYEASILRATQAVAQQQGLYLQKYQADVSTAHEAFRGSMQDYMAGVNRLIEQARLDQERLRAEYDMESSVALQSSIKEAEIGVARYEQVLSRYRTEAEVYRVEVEAELMAFRGNLDRAIQGLAQAQALYIQKYQSDIQQEVSRYNADVSYVLREVEVLIEEARLEHQRLQEAANREVGTELQNQARLAEAAVASYVQSLQRYGAQTQRQQQQIASVIESWSASYRKAVEPWVEQQRLAIQKHGTDTQAAVTAYQGAIALYEASEQRRLAQAQITLQEALEYARLSGQLSEAGAARQLEADVAGFSASIQAHQAALSGFTAKVEAAATEWNAAYRAAFEPWVSAQRMRLDLYAADLQAESTRFGGEVQKLLSGTQRVLQQASMAHQRAVQIAQQSTEVALRNEAETVSAQLQSFAQKLQLFMSEVDVYRTEAELAVQQYVQGLSARVRVYETQAGVEIRRFEADIAAMRTDLEARMATYRAAVERNIVAAQIARSEAQQEADNATNVALANKARRLEADIAFHQSQLGVHRQNVELYATQVQAAIGKYQAEHEARQNLLRSLNFELQRAVTRYRESFSAYLRTVWQPRSFVIRQPVI